ncbi:MAG: HEAT repeat domain-containing protein [Anaerotruncus sp.]|nr:HEAT repeat domain-containing protein [Anaerotruncus sp.]
MQMTKTLSASPTERSQTAKEFLDVKSFVASFVMALKNYALYPENHSISQKSLSTTKECLEEYFAGHELLRLNIEEGKLLFQGEIVHQDKPDEPFLTIPLFRDGIQWFEFREGLAIGELNTFLNLLTKHRAVKEEAEDDLSTALWEADLPHLNYKVDDAIWMGEPIVEFSNLRASPISIEQTEERAFESPTFDKKVNLSETEAGSFKLNFTDENKIKAMIHEEETRNCTKDCLDVLALILREQQSPEDYLTVIDFLVGEVQYALSQCEFNYILSFLESIESLSQTAPSDNPWLRNLSANFRQKISSPEVLTVLEQVWSQINTATDALMNALRKFLLMLPPEVISTLIPMLPRMKYPRVENMFVEVIAIHAGAGLINITELVDTMDERFVHRFITTFGVVGAHNTTKLLFDLTRHTSTKVREYAIHALAERDYENICKLFSRMEDEQPAIQHLICKHLGQQRSSTAERLLLAYLEKKRHKITNREHLLDCYRALGRCAGPQAIPILQKILLQRDWRALLGISMDPHRQGAALSLLLMPKEWNTKIILDSSRPKLFPGHQTCL